jgi:hypothetical protein
MLLFSLVQSSHQLRQHDNGYAAWHGNLSPLIAMQPSRDNIGATVDIDRAAGDALGERRGQVGTGKAGIYDVH